MCWVQINHPRDEWWFKIYEINIFALRWRNEIKRSSQLRTLLKREVENRTWNKIHPVRDLNLWPPRYRCSTLLTELTSKLGAGQCVGSRGSLNFISSPQCKYMNFIYLKSSFITLMVYFANTKTQFFAPFGDNIMIIAQHFPTKIARCCYLILRFYVPTRRKTILSIEYSLSKQ